MGDVTEHRDQCRSQEGLGSWAEVTPAWLTVVAKRRLIDHWRHLRARSRAVERIAGALPVAEAAVEPLGDDPEISAALDSLPARQRTLQPVRSERPFAADDDAPASGSGGVGMMSATVDLLGTTP